MSNREFKIKIPDVQSADQGQEKIIVTYQGETKKLLTHDYDEIYKIPGLYEYLFYDKFKCDSPNVVCSLLKDQLKKTSDQTDDLVVLDVGAGNGMVGEKFVDMGAETVLGIDIIEEAAQAVDRDRPDVYDSYYVVDLTDLPDEVEEKILDKEPNCLSIVAALGFGDIPPRAFAKSFNLISDQGWLAFNIKDEFVEKKDSTGFSGLIKNMVDKGNMKIIAKKLYRHRLCQDGTPLNYYAVVGKKIKDITEGFIRNFD
ncbi:MAG: methyltransferase [Dissulfuribacterales bacterium]